MKMIVDSSAGVHNYSPSVCTEIGLLVIGYTAVVANGGGPGQTATIGECDLLPPWGNTLGFTVYVPQVLEKKISL